jgi:hypothetical protein
MKKVFDNRQLAHIWAQRTQDYGKNANGSMYFSRDVIYSYGSHFVAAKIYNDLDVVLINLNKYSVTTAKHLSDIRRAVTQYQTWEVPDVLNPDSESNHLNFVNNVTDCMRSILQGNAFYSSMDIINEINIYRLYCEKFKLKMDSEVSRLLEPDNETIHDLQIIGVENSKRSIKRDQAKILKRDLKNKYVIDRTHSNLHLWLSNSESDFKPTDADIQLLADYSGHDYCRLNASGDEIITQRGAKVSIDSGVHALDLGASHGFDILIGKSIGNFKVESYNDSILKIGCHKINIEQVKAVLNV